ncbi:hypothetical protein [Limnohabitans sp.]|uniref:hypothetical protein n=1 Tax=Limnohabitans sp. TaxID=1907725 RepID=UPI0025BFFC70|nr:hypothetical protein [Limnohabitans sp.]
MQKLMHGLFYGIPFLVGLAVFGLVFYLKFKLCVDTTDFFEKNLRASLFAGFLTMGGFLLSLKTGIVIKIKESVYDSPEYVNLVNQNSAHNESITRYGPLRRLSRVLSVSVIFCLLTSILQFTLGLVSAWWASAICLAVATFAMGLLIASFVLIQVNLAQWFDFLEQHRKA